MSMYVYSKIVRTSLPSSLYLLYLSLTYAHTRIPPLPNHPQHPPLPFIRWYTGMQWMLSIMIWNTRE